MGSDKQLAARSRGHIGRRALVLFAVVLVGGVFWVGSAMADDQAPDAPVVVAAVPTVPPPPTPAPSPTPSPTPEPQATIAGSPPEALLIGGVEASKMPVLVAKGTTVCVPEQTYFKSEGERWTFQGWSNGSTDLCIKPTQADVYRPQFSHDILVKIHSVVGSIQSSQWTPYGEPLKLEAPETVANGPDVNKSRYRFQQWSDGDTPFQPQNSIAPTKPADLEVKYQLEHNVTISGPDKAGLQGSGWYPDGTTLTLRTPDTLPGDSDGQRWKFTQWVSDGQPAATIQNPQQTQAGIKVDAPYTIKAEYQKQFLIVAQNPAGSLKNDWVGEGQDVVIETPATIDIIPDQDRLVFKSWQGVDGIVSRKFGGPATQPVNVTAVYEHQFMLKVNSAHGSTGDGWTRAGTVATVAAPASIQDTFLFKSALIGFTGYPAGQSSVQVLVDKPAVLTALYRNEVDLTQLAMVLALPTLIVLAILVYRLVVLLRGRGSSGSWRQSSELTAELGEYARVSGGTNGKHAGPAPAKEKT